MPTRQFVGPANFLQPLKGPSISGPWCIWIATCESAGPVNYSDCSKSSGAEADNLGAERTTQGPACALVKHPRGLEGGYGVLSGSCAVARAALRSSFKAAGPEVTSRIAIDEPATKTTENGLGNRTSLLIAATGCHPTQPFYFFEDGDLSHYVDKATQIDYPDALHDTAGGRREHRAAADVGECQAQGILGSEVGTVRQNRAGQQQGDAVVGRPIFGVGLPAAARKRAKPPTPSRPIPTPAAASTIRRSWRPRRSRAPSML